MVSQCVGRVPRLEATGEPEGLNQIECWFSILVRRLLRRGNFTSTLDLKCQILSFIDYFNRTFAKPFVWKFLGYPNTASTG